MASLTPSTLSGAGAESGDVLLVYCPSLTLLDIVSIPTIEDYCGWEHHVFETADRNQDV